MTLTQVLGKLGMDANQPVQQVSTTDGIPPTGAYAIQLTGNSVAYILGPTTVLVVGETGTDPEVPGT